MIKISLSQNKEIFNAEMWGISKTIKVIEQKSRKVLYFLITSIFGDSQITINNLKKDHSFGSQVLKKQIYQKTE